MNQSSDSVFTNFEPFISLQLTPHKYISIKKLLIKEIEYINFCIEIQSDKFQKKVVSRNSFSISLENYLKLVPKMVEHLQELTNNDNKSNNSPSQNETLKSQHDFNDEDKSIEQK